MRMACAGGRIGGSDESPGTGSTISSAILIPDGRRMGGWFLGAGHAQADGGRPGPRSGRGSWQVPFTVADTPAVTRLVTVK
jgi:hypothetical protein